MSTQCLDCKHWIAGRICHAFNGEDDQGEIPIEIKTGEFDHKKIHPKQKNTITFEPITKENKWKH